MKTHKPAFMPAALMFCMILISGCGGRGDDTAEQTDNRLNPYLSG